MLVPMARLGLAHIRLHLVAQQLALGRKERQARPDVFREVKQAQLFAKLAMVALARLLQSPQIILQLLRRAPRGSVHALQHCVLLIAPPVRTRHAQQLEGLRIQLAGVLKVRPAAQIRKSVLGVKRDCRCIGRGLARIVLAAAHKAVNQLQLIGLRSKFRARVSSAYLAPHKGMLAQDNAPHAGFNRLQVVRCK